MKLILIFFIIINSLKIDNNVENVISDTMNDCSYFFSNLNKNKVLKSLPIFIESKLDKNKIDLTHPNDDEWDSILPPLN